MNSNLEGFAIIDKPAGMTSHDVVAKARRILGERKIGHAGTLDPDATGVLVLGVGRVTRLMRFIGERKSYTAQIKLGSSTTTQDSSGEIIESVDMSDVQDGEIKKTLEGFVGTIEQIPPMVSAVQINGMRLHELARKGIEVDRPARKVEIHSAEMTSSVEQGCFEIKVECGSGTYIRTMAHDLGKALGGVAHLKHLRRTAVLPFTLEDSVRFDLLDPTHLVPASAIRKALQTVVIDSSVENSIIRGQVINLAKVMPFPADIGRPLAVLTQRGTLLAVFEYDSDLERWKSQVVLDSR